MVHLRNPFTLSLILLGLLLAQAAPAAEAPLSPEVQQRLATLKAGYETFVLNKVTQPYENGIATLNAKATTTLKREQAGAAKRTNLDDLVRTKSDLERLGEGKILTEANDPPPEALKYIYATYKLELEKLEALKSASLMDANQRYDTGLAKVQNEMTASQQVEAALHVKKLREEVAAGLPVSSGSTSSVSTDSPQNGGENLLVNGSFQKGTSKWEMTTYVSSANPAMSVDKKVLFHDKPTLRVVNPALTDTHVFQKVKVKPDTRYRLSGFIKAEVIRANVDGINNKNNTDLAGACIAVANKRGERSQMVNTDTWTEVSHEFKTQDETELVFECRLGYFGASVSGTAWFAELAMTEVKAAP